VRPSKALTSSAGTGLRRAIGSRPGGGNLVWTFAFGVAAAQGAAVMAGTTAGPSVGAAAQAPTATTTSKASKADRMPGPASPPPRPWRCGPASPP
jgi:hypothetical protein